jgi:hypothetical protein
MVSENIGPLWPDGRAAPLESERRLQPETAPSENLRSSSAGRYSRRTPQPQASRLPPEASRRPQHQAATLCCAPRLVPEWPDELVRHREPAGGIDALGRRFRADIEARP